MGNMGFDAAGLVAQVAIVAALVGLLLLAARAIRRWNRHGGSR